MCNILTSKYGVHLNCGRQMRETSEIADPTNN